MSGEFEQMKLFDVDDPEVCKSPKAKFDDYEGFVEKFKAKKTTDDCYTPEPVYDAVADWVAKEYGVSRSEFVRPFYPGYDYKIFDYAGKIVVDNPPFSLLAGIIDFYILTGVKFFLFAPLLTSMKHSVKDCCFICCDASITYENGAVVNTAFMTNLEPWEIQIRTAPELKRLIKSADAKARKERKPPDKPKYKYPPEVVSIALVSTFARHGIPVTIRRDELVRIGALESQKRQGKSIFGDGFLTSHTKGAELEEARRQAEEARRQAEEARRQAEEAQRQVWELSRAELAVVEELERKRHDI